MQLEHNLLAPLGCISLYSEKAFPFFFFNNYFIVLDVAVFNNIISLGLGKHHDFGEKGNLSQSLQLHITVTFLEERFEGVVFPSAVRTLLTYYMGLCTRLISVCHILLFDEHKNLN